MLFVKAVPGWMPSDISRCYLNNAVAIWPVTRQGFQNTKWPAVLYS